MKTVKFFTLTLVLLLSGTVLFAETDGTTIKENSTTFTIILNDRVLQFRVPQVAPFNEPEVEFIKNFLVEKTGWLAPVIPMEATFNEEISESVDLKPVVPLEAPFSATL